MAQIIRKAVTDDLNAVSDLYDRVHLAEESGRVKTGWKRDIYPVRSTAEAAHAKGHLFVLVDKDIIKGAAIINREQHEIYAKGKWSMVADDASVMVMHTLVIDPEYNSKGLGRAFIKFYADYALANGCEILRIDTNAINLAARGFYKKLGFREAGIEPTDFNGLGKVNLVLLEHRADQLAQVKQGFFP